MLLNEQIKANLGDKKIVGVRQGDKFILGRHNLVPNGRGKYTSGTVEVRRNRALNPRQVQGGSTAETGERWSWTRSYISNFDGLHGVTTACRMTSPSEETTGGTRGFDFYGNVDIPAGTSGSYTAFPVTPGETLHLECSFAMSFEGGAYLIFRFHDGAGNWITSSISSPSFTPSSVGEVTPAYIDMTVPDGALYLSASLRTIGVAPVPANATIDMSELYIGAPGDFFDGSYSPDPDLTPSWTGAENASASVLSGSTVRGYGVHGSNGSKVYQSTDGNSISWVKVTPATNGSTDSFAQIDATPAYLTPGKWVGISGIAHIDSPLTGDVAAVTRTRTIAIHAGSEYAGPSVPNEAGDWPYLFALQVVKPVLYVRAYCGHSGGEGIKWTNIIVAQANTEEEALRMVRAPYRDGDFPGWTWDGTPGESASRGLS